MPPLDYDYMRVMTVGHSCTLSGLLSNDHISYMQHDSTSLAHRSVFLTILLLMKSIKKDLPPLLYISLLISTFTYNEDQLRSTITNNRTGLGYLKTWQKCDTNKLDNAMDDIATSMWGNS